MGETVTATRPNPGTGDVLLDKYVQERADNTRHRLMGWYLQWKVWYLECGESGKTPGRKTYALPWIRVEACRHHHAIRHHGVPTHGRTGCHGGLRLLLHSKEWETEESLPDTRNGEVRGRNGNWKIFLLLICSVQSTEHMPPPS